MILIGLIALARKFVILDPETGPAKVAALAGATLALGATYWLLRERDDRTAGKAQMISRDLRHAQNVGARHRWHNRLQTVLLVLTLLGIAAVAGSLLLGDGGLWLALAAAGFTLLLEPAAASGLTLRLYGARPCTRMKRPIFGLCCANWRRGPGCLPCRYRTTCPAGSSTPSPPVRSITRPSR